MRDLQAQQQAPSPAEPAVAPPCYLTSLREAGQLASGRGCVCSHSLSRPWDDDWAHLLHDRWGIKLRSPGFCELLWGEYFTDLAFVTLRFYYGEGRRVASFLVEATKCLLLREPRPKGEVCPGSWKAARPGKCPALLPAPPPLWKSVAGDRYISACRHPVGLHCGDNIVHRLRHLARVL